MFPFVLQSGSVSIGMLRVTDIVWSSQDMSEPLCHLGNTDDLSVSRQGFHLMFDIYRIGPIRGSCIIFFESSHEH